MTKPIKISRSAIKQTLKDTPIENILVGSLNVDKVNLTKKQKDFARKVAEGKPKAQAYRETYNSNAKPQSQAEQASRLSANPKIASMIDAFQVANEAREYLIPAQIRTMAIQNLVGIAIDEGEKTSNKLKALELIGKMSEVALFTERKELIHTNNSADIKEKLLEGLKLAFSNSRHVNDLAKRKAESLLIELEDARQVDAKTIYAEEAEADDEAEQTRTPFVNAEPADPLTPDPQNSDTLDIEPLHSNPHKGSLPIANPHKGSLADPKLAADSLLNDLTLTAVIVTNPLESDTCVSIGNYPNELQGNEEGEGVINPGQSAPEDIQETPPVNISNKKG